MSTPDFPHSLSDDSPEAESAIDFFSEDVDFELLNSSLVQEWLQEVILHENKQLQRLSFIFCSDEYLYQMNVDYLQHDTYTDVITFPYGEGDMVEGDIFISIERVKENAALFQSTFERELYRVMVHGVLHLCGYGDKSEEEEAEMREKENMYIRRWDELA
ncbi:MAG: rRNA maturation RNase YbeY [Saprospirales bacterium]|nr:rRNA maturation RNase YbeY [Saprospirales bacterium]MBK8489989.1 rRNA maturation RNase YbeY [Saprospirales bacterium]